MANVQAILATLGYLVSPDRSQVLLIHRNKRPDDLHVGKYNGLGGKLAPDEHVLDGMRREIREESGLIVDHLTLRGTISWPGFGKQGEDWFGFVFLIDRWHGELQPENHEGTLEWVSVASMLDLPMWPSDRHFIPMVFDHNPRPFYGCMPFSQGKMVSWQYERL